MEGGSEGGRERERERVDESLGMFIFEYLFVVSQITQNEDENLPLLSLGFVAIVTAHYVIAV